MSLIKRRNVIAGLLLAATATSRTARAEDGVAADRILFGQAVALEGPSAALGTGMRDGILAAFKETNAAGGVNGRRLELIARDDGYDPNKSIEAANALLDHDKVFALIGSVGTPTSAAVEPIALARSVPFIGPFTGASFLRSAGHSNVINLRASYAQETEEMLERLTKDLKVSRVAILYQDDAYGRAGLEGLQAALAKRGMELAAEGTYERNTTAVKSALLAIRKAAPQAVVMIGAYKPCAEFIRLARQVKFDPLFLNVSFVGSEALAKELGGAGAGVLVTQVVPLPYDTGIPLIKRYQAALTAAVPDAAPGFVSLEGYLAGRLAIMGLERTTGEPTRQAFLAVFQQVAEFDLAGLTLHYGPGRNYGSDTVFVTKLGTDGRFSTVTTLANTLPTTGG
jgi:branched-chain amino acid transport system substrate-binding protein